MKIKKRLKKFLSWVFLAVLLSIAALVFVKLRPAQAAWLSDGWKYRVKLTIDHTKVAANQTDFPVYVNLANVPVIFLNANKVTGGDLRVTKGDGTTELPRELVSYDANQKTGELYFKYTGTLSSTVDTDIYIYYGNAAAGDYLVADTYGRNNVWDSNYVGVYHLNEASGTRYDSTSKANDLAASGTVPTTSSGKLGSATDFNQAGNLYRSDANLSTDFPGKNGQTTTNFSVSFWIKPRVLSYLDWLGKNNNNGWGFYDVNPNAAMAGFYKSATVTQASQTPDSALATGTWTHIAYAHDTVANTDNIYNNGNATQTTGRTGDPDANTASFMVGGTDQWPDEADGVIDEVRVSKTARSATWVTTEYNNQNSPTSFFKLLGKEEKAKVPVLYFSFNEGFGSSTHDSTGKVLNTDSVPVVGNSNSTSAVSGASLTFAHTVEAGVNILVVAVAGSDGTVATDSIVTGVTYSGQALTKVREDYTTDNDTRTSYWYLLNPPQGAADVVASYTASCDHGIFAASMSILNAAAQAPEASIGKNATTGGAVSQSITTVSNYALILDMHATSYSGGSLTISPPGIQRYNIDPSSNYGVSSLATNTAGVYTLNWLHSTTTRGYAWTMIAIKPSTTQAIAGVEGSFQGSPGPAWQPVDACIASRCLSFNGTSSYIFATSITTNLKTVSFWVKPKTNTESLVDFDGGTHYISASAGTITATGFAATPIYYINGVATTTPTLVANTWQHLAITTNTAFDVTSLNIGRKSTTYFSGFMDEFKIYDYVRTAAEIKADYAASAGIKGSAATLGGVNPNLLGPVSTGLTGYWKMDEKTGTTAVDFSGNGSTATFTNAPTWGIGYFSSGVIMNGTNSYLTTTTDKDTLDLRNGGYSAFIWEKTAKTATDDILFFKGAGNATDPGFDLSPDTSGTGKLQLYISDGSSYIVNNLTGLTDVVDGQWHLVGFTWNPNSGAKLYVDGKLEATTNVTSTANINSTSPLMIGGYSAANMTVSGPIDEARIYNRELSQSEIQALYTWAPPPIGYWNFNENGGVLFNDLSGNANSGALGDGVAGSNPTWTSGKFGGGLKFDGTNDDAVVLDNDIFSFGNSTDDFTFTVGAWIYPKNSISRYVVSKSSEWRLRLSSAGYVKCSVTDLGGSIDLGRSTGVALPSNAWHYVACSYDGTKTAAGLKIYVDGIRADKVDDNSGTGYVAMRNSNNPVVFGADGIPDPLELFIGTIDEVKLYNYTRTPAQIIEDMNATHPMVGSPVGSAMVHWKLDEGYGTVANNSGNAGSTYNGAITSGTWSLAGKFGKALTFSASTNVSKTIADPAYTNTLSMWLYPTTSAASKTLTTAAKLTTDASSRPVYGACVGTALPLTTWTHIIAVSDGASSCKIYQNGLQTADGGTGVTFGTALNLGATSFTGLIDDFKLYSGAMTFDQAKVEYNNGKALRLGSLSTTAAGVADNSAARDYCVPGDAGTCNTPVAHWKLDENVGTSAYDISGNGLIGTLTNAPTYKPGKLGSALNFNGSNTYVTVADPGAGSVLDFTSGNSVTLSAWIKPTNLPSTGDAYTFLSKGCINSTTCNYLFQIYNNAGSMRETFCYNETGNGNWHCYESDASIITAGQWQHLEFSYTFGTGSSAKLYYNGQLQAGAWQSGSGNVAPDVNNNALWLGADSAIDAGINEVVNGLVDEVIIYNYIRTPAQIAWDYNHGAPVASYKFNECQGTTINNYAKSANNSAVGLNAALTVGASGTYTSAGTCGSGTASQTWNAGTTGKYGSAIAFDGNDDYLQVTANSLINAYLKDQLTLAAWVYPVGEGGGSYGRIFDKRSTTTDNSGTGYSLYAGESDGSSLRLFSSVAHSTTFANSYSLSTAGRMTLNAWHLVAMTYNQDGDKKIKIYLDGNLVPLATSQAGVGATPDDSAVNLRIGNAASVTTRAFNGLIDDSEIYNYTLTADQIKTLYNQSAVVRFGQ